MTKRCPKCAETKPADRYSPAKQTSDGLAGWCRDCCRIACRESYAKHGHKYKRAKRRPAKACEYCGKVDPSCKRRWCSACRELATARSNQLRQYGLTLKYYEAMVERQDARCLICHQQTPLVVDHCHASGEVRGLLCVTCNIGLGAFKDNPVLFKAASEYLGRLLV